MGVARLRLGDTPTAIGYLEQAVKLYRSAGLVSSLSHLLQDLHFAYMRAGRLDEMGSCLQEVVAIRRKLRGASALALALNALGYYYHRRGNYQEALSTFEEGLQLVAGAPDRRSECYLLASLGDLKRDLGQYIEAQLLYDKALQLVSPDTEPNLQSTILISLSTMRRWQGRASEAVLLAEEASRISTTHQIACESAMAEITLWLARAEMNNPCQALAHLKTSLEDLHNQKARLEMLEVLGGCIHIANMCGDEKITNEYLMLAGSLAEEVGTAQSLAVEVARNPSLEALIVQMPHRAQLIADLQELREAQRKLSNNANIFNSIFPANTYRLRVLTLGQEKVERNGKAISVAEWQAASPRELFFYLFFNGSKSRSDITLVFWPESNPVQARSLFHTALHCARQALGQNVIVFEDERYFINTDLQIECDAHQLESWTRQARLLTPRDARADDLWRKAMAQYRGDFLPSLDFHWVVARREAYGAMHLDALVGLGNCARARNDLKTAVEWFSQALAVDPYSEDIYRQIIRCYSQLGEMSKIRACFYELKVILKDELGIEPSQETITLVRSIIGDS
jgi:DNA-binding SARP family transcriptional activator